MILKWEMVRSECPLNDVIRLGLVICLNAFHMILLKCEVIYV